MKTKDLRLGNYVTDNSGFTMYVVGIYEDTVLLNFEGNEGDILEVKEKDLKPIKLTKTKILKCSFIENVNYEFPSFDEYIHKDNKWFGIGDFNNKYFIVDFLDQKLGCDHKLMYLHQLQNLFYALSQKELEINL